MAYNTRKRVDKAEKIVFDKIFKLCRPRELSSYVISVIEETIDIAMADHEDGTVGLRLAAAFDLLASIEYYHSVANRGWTYCSEEPQMMLYPYTNTCPRCIGKSKFKYAKANKPESGQIGMVTTELLCQMLETVFKKNGRNINVYKASEPIDAVIYDEDSKKMIIAEVKSAPLMTIPLAMMCEHITETVDGELIYIKHSILDNPMVKHSSIGLYFPKAEDLQESFIPLVMDWSVEKPFYTALHHLFASKPEFFHQYYKYWETAYHAYSKKERNCPLFWMTNGCGQPVPRPDDWPRRRGSGYESVSDGKTSVGMDRTDDIKKAIYQVLKLGSEYKLDNDNIKTAIISNIHAVRHYDEYLLTLRDVIWTLDSTHVAKRAIQLDPDTPMYNLFDGILSFTYSDIRDEWIEEIFNFGG